MYKIYINYILTLSVKCKINTLKATRYFFKNSDMYIFTYYILISETTVPKQYFLSSF